MPQIRPFRALRYDPEPSATSALVVAPPYDVIGRTSTRAPAGPRTRATSSAWTCRPRSPATSRDDRYRRAARTLAAWRSDGTLHKDPRPSIYVYEQTYRVPGTRRRADPARLLRPPPARAVRARRPASCRTSGRWPAPREDRYKLLRATGVNTSPVVGLYDDPSGAAGAGPRDR